VTDASGESAYLDIEFGYAYGSCRTVIMPIEIGTVVYRPEDDLVRYIGDQFRYDINVEIWKKVTDDCGKTIGVATTVANMARGEYGMAYDHAFRVPEEEVTAFKAVARKAFEDLRLYMSSLLATGEISRVVVFAADMERKAFHVANVSLDGCALVDLQREIKRRFAMKQVLSLDRLARLIDFGVDGAHISSTHFRYSVPDDYRHQLEVHRGMGDAVRTFLLAREYEEKLPDLEARLRVLIDICRNSG
jgi:hypothetical protein